MHIRERVLHTLALLEIVHEFYDHLHPALVEDLLTRNRVRRVWVVPRGGWTRRRKFVGLLVRMPNPKTPSPQER